MMADQGAAKAMLDQPGRALRTFQPLTAGAAQGDRRVAAAIEEQQRLLAGRQRLLHRLDDRRRQPAAARRRRALEIDGRQDGEILAAVPRRQMRLTVSGATCALCQYLLADIDPTGVKHQYTSTIVGGVQAVRVPSTLAPQFPLLGPRAAQILHVSGVLPSAAMIAW